VHARSGRSPRTCADVAPAPPPWCPIGPRTPIAASPTTSAAGANSHFRRLEQAAIGIGSGSAVVVDTRIDTVGTGVAANHGELTIRQTVIQGASAGISSSRGSIELDEVRVEAADVVGINLSGITQPTLLAGARNVVIEGGLGRPFHGTAQDASSLSDPALGNRIAGNVNDTILISRYNEADGELIRTGFHWRAPEGLSLAGTGLLRIEPGASLTVHHTTFGLSLGVPLVARGTVDSPVTLVATGSTPASRRSGHFTESGGADVIAHAVVRGMILVSATDRRCASTRPPSSTAAASSCAPGSRVLATTLADPADSAGIILAASGVTVDDVTVTRALGHGIRIDSAGATISRCTITGSAGDGILVRAASSVSIHDCNLEDNGGPGVRNVDAPAVDARFNWWGDPAGPLGATGDGVGGPVQIAPFRILPVPTAGSHPSSRARRQ
jgi:hypothetical protein